MLNSTLHYFNIVKSSTHSLWIDIDFFFAWFATRLLTWFRQFQFLFDLNCLRPRFSFFPFPYYFHVKFASPSFQRIKKQGKKMVEECAVHNWNSLYEFIHPHIWSGCVGDEGRKEELAFNWNRFDHIETHSKLGFVNVSDNDFVPSNWLQRDC